MVRTRGFTLIELIVVITIIGILGTLVTLRVSGVRDEGYKTRIKSDLRRVVEAAEIYNVRTGAYAETLEELTGTTDESGRVISGLEEANDPWNRPYGYELRDGRPTAWCLGHDGVEGGEQLDSDYVYPEAR